mmetsp:Transcript_38106/g.109971  ORF Transcript_38106/g.109971 Transcript_38106/m.109971 type:complete len:277 (-) Transcript_38106:226-1056(-)
MSASPSRVSPRRLELRCRASKLGNVVTALRSTHQSMMPLPSRTSDFSLGNGFRVSPSRSKMGMPSASLLYAKCRCSRPGKTAAASMFSSVSHVTIVLFSTNVRTRQTKGCSTRRWSHLSVGAPRGTGRTPPAGKGSRRVLVSDSQSSCGQSSHMETTSAQSPSKHLSSQRLFKFGRLQSPSHTSSGQRVSRQVSARAISTKPSSRCCRCSMPYLPTSSTAMAFSFPLESVYSISSTASDRVPFDAASGRSPAKYFWARARWIETPFSTFSIFTKLP